MANSRPKSKSGKTARRPKQVDHPSADEPVEARDMIDYLREYAREKPEVAALWCLGIGFILGWKLKPW